MRGTKLDMVGAARQAVGCQHGVTLDGHGQHEAVIVIGVLADKVHPAGCGGEPAWRPSIRLFEFPGSLFRQFVRVLIDDKNNEKKS